MTDVDLSSSVHLHHLAQAREKLGFFLPRSVLNWAEIHARPTPFPPQEVEKALDFWRTRRVALVKQTAYGALYSRTNANSWVETAFSSACHLGPLAFLAELKADYHIVRQAPDSETFLWREKYAYDPDPLASTRRREEKMDNLEKSTDGISLPFVEDIPWNQYDLVVGLDVPIPSRIVRKCPQTLWAYYSTEAGGPLQKNSLLEPAAGYQLFLNHGFRRYRTRPRNRPHVLEFPFQFQSAQNWLALGSSLPSPSLKKQNILVERHSHEIPQPASALPLVLMNGRDSLPDYLAHLFGARFAIQTTSKVRWGNWAVETILAGALFLGNAASLAIRSPLLPGLDFRSLATALHKANELVEHPQQENALRAVQTDTIEELCFRRPLIELTQKAREFFR